MPKSKSAPTAEPSTLIIYEMIPETTQIYLVPDKVITAEQRDFLKQAAGQLINADDDNDGMQFLNNALAPKLEHCSSEAPDEWKTIWAKYLIEDKSVVLSPLNVTSFVWTGFVL